MNKRTAKKIIKAVTEDVFYDAYILSLMLDEKHQDDLAKIMTRIIDWKEENIKKLSHIDGKNDPKLVKGYFRKVNEKAKTEINEIAQKLAELSKEVEE